VFKIFCGYAYKKFLQSMEPLRSHNEFILIITLGKFLNKKIHIRFIIFSQLDWESFLVEQFY